MGYEIVKGQRVLVTGAAGTVGMALLKQLSELETSSLYGIDNSETGLFEAASKSSSSFEPVLCDVRDFDRLETVTRGVDIIFHAAALKHVPICEGSPIDAIKTNILGVQNVIRAAERNQVSRVVFTSTDKAVNPFNVMGASKLMGEQLIRAANVDHSGQVFVSTRFGNVLGSSGSVIPVFARQIKERRAVTVTSGEMTRFVMGLDEAIELVIEAGNLARGGEIFITKMRAIRIQDLAEVMIENLSEKVGGKYTSGIEVIGARPGEKTFEELMNQEEVRRSYELENHFVVLPAFDADARDLSMLYGCDHLRKVELPYNSATQEPLSKIELAQYLRSLGVLP